MNLGFGEILVILVLALLFFGPSKLPQLGASLGEAIKGFKKGLAEANEESKPVVAASTATVQTTATNGSPLQTAPTKASPPTA